MDGEPLILFMIVVWELIKHLDTAQSQKHPKRKKPLGHPWFEAQIGRCFSFYYCAQPSASGAGEEDGGLNECCIKRYKHSISIENELAY